MHVLAVPATREIVLVAAVAIAFVLGRLYTNRRTNRRD